MNFKINTLLISSLLFLQGCFDFGCMLGGGYEYTSYGTDLYIFESDDNLSTFHNTSVFNYSSLDSRPEINYEIEDARTTVDGTASFYFDHIPMMIDYGFNEKDSVDLDIYKEFPDYYIHDRNVDLLPLTSSSVFTILRIDSLPDPYNEGVFHPWHLRESSILSWHYDSAILDTLSYSKTSFQSKNKFGSSTFYSPRYDVAENVYFISKRNDYLITTDSTNSTYYYNDYFAEAFLVKHNKQSGSLDSLASVPYSKSDLIVRGNSIAIYDSKKFRIISTDKRELIPKTFGNNLVMGNEGQSLTYNKGKVYLRISDNRTINLWDIIPDINYAFPSENKIAIISNNQQTLSVLDVETEELIRQIHIEDIEGIPSSPSKRSTYTFHLPLFGSESTLKFIVMDSHYFNDPDEPCD